MFVVVAPTVDVVELAFGFVRDFGKSLGPNPKRIAAVGLGEQTHPRILLAASRTAISIGDDPAVPFLLALVEAQLFVEVLCDYYLPGSRRRSLVFAVATFIRILLMVERTEDQQRLG